MRSISSFCLAMIDFCSCITCHSESISLFTPLVVPDLVTGLLAVWGLDTAGRVVPYREPRILELASIPDPNADMALLATTSGSPVNSGKSRGFPWNPPGTNGNTGRIPHKSRLNGRKGSSGTPRPNHRWTKFERKSSKDIGVEEPGGRRRVVGRLRLLLATFLSLAIVSSSGGLKQISNFRDHRVGRTWTHARSPVSGPLGRPAGRRVSSRDVLGLSSGMHRLSYRRSAEGVDGETGVGRGCTGEEADEALDDVEDEDDVD
eukprot:36807-Amorphochlora_amoeboformis.AAC.2